MGLEERANNYEFESILLLPLTVVEVDRASNSSMVAVQGFGSNLLVDFSTTSSSSKLS